MSGDPSDRRLLTTGIVGIIITALCCFTPVLAVLLGFVGLSALLGWLDVVVNDLLPERIVAHTLLKQRHFLYAVLGAAYLIKAFVGVSAGSVGTDTAGSFVVLLSFLGTACICAWYVFTEVAGTHYAQR